MYAEVYGVDPSLEELAKWLQWADASWATVTGPDRYKQTQYNLEQFWKAAPSYPYDGGVIHLDGLAHRILGWLYYFQMGQADTPDVQNLANLAQQEFQRAYDDFNQVEGDETNAAQMLKRLGKVQADAQEWKANQVDTSYTAAFQAQIQKEEAAVGSALSLFDGSVTSYLVWAGIGLAAVVGLSFFMRRR